MVAVGQVDATILRKSALKFGAVDASISISESYEHTADVTDHPIETGSEISDHRTVKPVVVNIDGAIVRANDEERTNTPGAGPAPSDAYQALLDMHQSKETFELVTGLATYKNMVFTRLSVKRDETSGRALYFTAGMKQILRVSSKTAIVPKEKIPVKTNLGDKPTPPAPKKAQAEAKDKSTLKRLFGGSASKLRGALE